MAVGLCHPFLGSVSHKTFHIINLRGSVSRPGLAAACANSLGGNPLHCWNLVSRRHQEVIRKGAGDARLCSWCRASNTIDNLYIRTYNRMYRLSKVIVIC